VNLGKRRQEKKKGKGKGKASKVRPGFEGRSKA